jgi:hypothetical protein
MERKTEEMGKLREKVIKFYLTRVLQLGPRYFANI